MSEPPAAGPPPGEAAAQPSPEGGPSRAGQPSPEDRPGPEPPPAGASTTMDSARLLVQALARLAPGERDQVYTWLLGTSLSLQPANVAQLARRLDLTVRPDPLSVQQQDFGPAGADLVRSLVRGPGSAAQQMVPVRFSADQHARLRAWCAEHGFSMATVIRGLVDRFLDSQQPGGG